MRYRPQIRVVLGHQSHALVADGLVGRPSANLELLMLASRDC